MSDNEFYHEALIRRLRERDDCDDDIGGACDEIEDCYEEIARLRAEVERLRLTDAEREAVETFAFDRPMDRATTAQTAATLRALLARLGGAT